MFDRVDRFDATRNRRIGIVSDSHGPIDPRILQALESCDLLIHAGDLGGMAALDALAAIAETVTVRGNNDTPGRWLVSERAQLAMLPEVLRINLCGGDLILAHGHQIRQARQRHCRLREAFPDALAVVYGHSHRLRIDMDAEPWVLNPGACGRTRTYGGPSALILARQGRRWTISTRRFVPLARVRTHAKQRRGGGSHGPQ